jgi:alkyl sulfatase BDS1-like metallo-beta-lactamase superfamily hydrolase
MPPRALLADAYEQMGYQAESGPWRNVYLAGATELRNGVTQLPVPNAASAETIQAMPLDLFLDFLGVRLNAGRVGAAHVEFNLELTDVNEKWTFGVENSAIHYSSGRHADRPDASLVTTRAALNDVLMGTQTLEQLIVAGPPAPDRRRGKAWRVRVLAR